MERVSVPAAKIRRPTAQAQTKVSELEVGAQFMTADFELSLPITDALTKMACVANLGRGGGKKRGRILFTKEFDPRDPSSSSQKCQQVRCQLIRNCIIFAASQPKISPETNTGDHL